MKLFIHFSILVTLIEESSRWKIFSDILYLQTKSTHIRVLHEAIRSAVIISDLFMDKSQFTWMMEIFLELSKMHTVEDELLHQYLIVGICKAVSILNPVSLIWKKAQWFPNITYIMSLGNRNLRTSEKNIGSVFEESVFVFQNGLSIRTALSS